MCQKNNKYTIQLLEILRDNFDDDEDYTGIQIKNIVNEILKKME